MKIIDKNTVRFRFTMEPPARGIRRVRMTSRNRGRLQGALSGVLLSAAIGATWGLSGLEIGQLLIRKPAASGTIERQAGVQTSVLALEARSTPLPSPVPDWPRKSLHLPAAYHQAGHAVMARALGMTVGEIDLEVYGGCKTCHSPGVSCLANGLNYSPTQPRKNAALLYTAGWTAAGMFGHAGRFGDPDGLDPDYLAVGAQASELGLSVEEIKQQTARILNQPGNRRAIEAMARRLATVGRVSRDEVERIYAQSQTE